MKIDAIFSLLKRPGQRTVSVEEMQAAIEAGAMEGSTRATGFKREMLELAGGGLTVGDVQTRLQYPTTRAVCDAVESRRLLAVDDNGTKLFPAFQFDGGQIIPAMNDILQAVPNANPWAILQYMVRGDEGLGDDLPMDLIRQGDHAIERAVRFARTLED